MYEPIKIEKLPDDKVDQIQSAFLKVCQEFLNTSTDNPYYDVIKSATTSKAKIDRTMRAFRIYAPYLAPGTRVLDWGCRHAPHACMMRALYDDLELHGCDIMAEDFSAFYRYARLNFKQISHEYKLPYESGYFDTVISGGVLEHVAFEHESISEIWRILKDDGLFIVTFLPNKTSLSENLSRLLGMFGGHNRLYGLSQMKDTFLRSGFVIEACGYHQVIPTFGDYKALSSFVGLLANVDKIAERTPVIKTVAANLFFVLRRVRHM